MLLSRIVIAMPLRRPIPESLPLPEAEPYVETVGGQRAELGSPKERVRPLSYEISELGAISVYGLGPFPVTLTYEQWQQLLVHAEELRSFLETHQSRLPASK
jgi:hypothetical protein